MPTTTTTTTTIHVEDSRSVLHLDYPNGYTVSMVVEGDYATSIAIIGTNGRLINLYVLGHDGNAIDNPDAVQIRDVFVHAASL